MAINDGGPAFPSTKRKMTEKQWDAYEETHGDETVSGGMSLRDYFAAKAMQGILAGKAGNEEMWNDEDAGITARQAVERADALIAELAKADSIRAGGGQ